MLKICLNFVKHVTNLLDLELIKKINQELEFILDAEARIKSIKDQKVDFLPQVLLDEIL